MINERQEELRHAPAPLFPNLDKRLNVERRPALDNGPVGERPIRSVNGVSEPGNATTQPRAMKPRKMLTERDLEVINKIMNDIDNAEKSDVEAPGFEGERERYITKGKKRVLDTAKVEDLRRKVRDSCLSFSFPWPFPQM